MLYHASDRVIKDLKASIKEEQEKASRATEAKRRRAMRGGSRGGMDKQTVELSFLMGMTDTCPRCGEDFTEMGDDQHDNFELQKLHLMHCTDTVKHQKYEHIKKVAVEKQLKCDKQQEVQCLASWEFLGGNNGQLWLLNEDQLKAKAASLQLDTIGDKDTLIDRIVSNEQRQEEELNSGNNDGKKRKLLTIINTNETDQKELNQQAISDNSSTAMVVSNSKNKGNHNQHGSSSSTTISTNRRSTHDDASSHQNIPSNYSSYDTKQLRSIIASQGLLSQLPKRAVKKDMLALLERKLFDDVVYISD